MVAFGRLEYLVKLCVKSLLGTGFTKGMAHAESKRQFTELCKEAKKLAESKLSAVDARRFSNAIDRILSLAEERNDIVHALWTATSNGASLRTRPEWVKATKSVNWDKGRVVRVSELRACRQKMEEIHQELDQIRRAWP